MLHCFVCVRKLLYSHIFHSTSPSLCMLRTQRTRQVPRHIHTIKLINITVSKKIPMDQDYKYKSPSLRQSEHEHEWVELAQKAAQGVRFCNAIAQMVNGNENQARDSRIEKIQELRDKIITLINRVHEIDQRVCVLRKLDAHVTAFDESRNEVNVKTASFDRAFIRRDSKYTSSHYATPHRSPQTAILTCIYAPCNVTMVLLKRQQVQVHVQRTVW